MQTQHDVKPQSDAAAAEAEGDLPAEQVELPQDEPVELVPTSADLIASEQEQIPELTPHSSPVRLCAADSLCLEVRSELLWIHSTKPNTSLKDLQTMLQCYMSWLHILACSRDTGSGFRLL